MPVRAKVIKEAGAYIINCFHEGFIYQPIICWASGKIYVDASKFKGYLLILDKYIR